MMHMHRPQHKAEARPQTCQHMQQHHRIQAAAQPDFDGATGTDLWRPHIGQMAGQVMCRAWRLEWNRFGNSHFFQTALNCLTGKISRILLGQVCATHIL